MEAKLDTDYKGIRVSSWGGRKYFKVTVCTNNKSIHVGLYKDKLEAIRAYDLYIIRMGLNKKTHFLKKKLA
jgi:hypothetical protein